MPRFSLHAGFLRFCVWLAGLLLMAPYDHLDIIANKVFALSLSG